MNKLTIKNIVDATKGNLIIGKKEQEFEKICRDTRLINEGDVYVGIKGENFDGNTLWKKAFENGASAVIVQDVDFSKEDLEEYSDKNIIKVDNTVEAISDIARYKRELYGKDFPVIGVTGSVGKTSTKDIISNVVAQKYKTLKTQGNSNNSIGLPFTLFNLDDHEAAVIEMGMNQFGEIENLTKIAEPTIAVITNVGTSHIGNLGSREGILKAKLEILEGMNKKILVINNDNDMLHKYYLEKPEDVEIHTFGIENKSDIMAEEIKLKENSSEFICNLNGKKFKVTVPVGGIHFVYNALCAITVGNLLDLSVEQMINGIQTFELTKKRMDITNLKNGVTIINDSYNASFESMQASLKYLSGLNNKRKIAVLGDMFELGEFSKELHEKVGKEVVKNKIDLLICSGENSKFIVESAKREGMQENNIFYFDSREKIAEFIKENWQSGDAILFKASNGMKFFEIVEELIASERIKLGVICGGMSTENEVSCVSAESVIANLDKNKYEIYPIFIDKDGKWYTIANIEKNEKFGTKINGKQPMENIVEYLKTLDVIFPVLHGLYGEDGTIQGLFELLKIPYVGCKVLASTVGMDKVYTKVIFEKAGIKQANYVYIRKYNDKFIYVDKFFNEKIMTVEDVAKISIKELKFPMFVKPSNSGSSVGITKANSIEELVDAIKEAAKYDNKILIEQGIDGREVECAVLGNEDVISSCVGEILAADEFYSYDAKYNNQESKTLIPANIAKEKSDEIKRLAVKAFKAIDGKGLSRVDFFVEDGTEQVYINEINTMPGFTDISMYPKLFGNEGISYSELLDKLIELASL